MGEMIIQRESLVAIADAIREATGETKLYTLDEMYEKLCPEFIYMLTQDDYYPNSISIPNGTIKIRDYMFDEYGLSYISTNRLTSVSFPTGLKNIGAYAFRNCSGLTSISLPEGLTDINGYAFNGCTGLTEVVFPTSLVNIDNSAFSQCTGLTSISLPEGLTSIRLSAFSGCTGLTEVVFPMSLASIEISAFYGCTGLTQIIFKGVPNTIDSLAFYNCSGVTINVPWSEGEVAGAPWGISNATINYNYAEGA